MPVLAREETALERVLALKGHTENGDKPTSISALRKTSVKYQQDLHLLLHTLQLDFVIFIALLQCSVKVDWQRYSDIFLILNATLKAFL